MRRTFYVPRRFHPAYSLLGRYVQRVIGDERRAEALFLVVLSMILLGLLLVQCLAWTFLNPAASWLSQVGALTLCVVTCVLGYKPAITVTCTEIGLCLCQGLRALKLDYTEITSIETISALLFHRHYRRYAATEAFVNRMERDLLLLETTHGPVVIGLPPRDHAALVLHLEAQQTSPFAVLVLDAPTELGIGSHA